MFGPCCWWLSYRVIKAYFWGLVRGVWFSQQVSSAQFLRNPDLWTSSFPHFTVKFACDLNMSGLAGLGSFSLGIFWLTGAGTPSSTIEAACTDYYFLTSKKKQKLYPFPAFSPSLPPFPSLVQLSGQWDRGKEPSMYSQTSPPSLSILSHPDGLLFSCAARRRFQPGQMFNTGDNMFAPHRCFAAPAC